MQLSGSASRVAAFLFLAVGVFAQQSAAPPATSGNDQAAKPKSTIRGCLRGDRGNYIVIEDKTSMVYVLKGVGKTLDKQTNKPVEVDGRILPGTVKTGVRMEKAGSNPADTVKGIDGVPFQVDNPQSDVRTTGKKCQAADAGQ
jgi:hypothetical protein